LSVGHLPCHEPFHELLAFSQSIRRFAQIAELRQRQGRGGDRPRKIEEDGPDPVHRDRALDS
jgi:hypothetical protein